MSRIMYIILGLIMIPMILTGIVTAVRAAKNVAGATRKAGAVKTILVILTGVVLAVLLYLFIMNLGAIYTWFTEPI